MKKCWNSVKNFAQNQVGANTLEVVLILALAGIACVGIYKTAEAIFGWNKDKIEIVTNESTDHETAIYSSCR